MTILSPNEGAAFASDSLAIELQPALALRPGRHGGGARWWMAARFPARRPAEPCRSHLRSEATARMKLTGLPQRDLTLSLVARAGGLESTPASIRLKFTGAPQPAASAAAQNASTVSLYALVVGVSKFKDASIPALAWAAKDARDFAAALQGQQGRLYRKVEVKLLADEDADNGAILDGLTWLQRQVSQGDVGVVFLAGHGVTIPSGDYFYIPYNARIETVAGMPLPTRGSSVPDTEISHTLKQLAGNALFFFDTCHAGKASGVSFRALDYNKLINEIAGSANAIVLASSTGSELEPGKRESGSTARSPWRCSKAWRARATTTTPASSPSTS